MALRISGVTVVEDSRNLVNILNAGSTNVGGNYVIRDSNGSFSANTITATLNGKSSNSFVSDVSLQTNAYIEFTSDGLGGTPLTTFNGSSVRTISYNTIGASPAAGSTNITTLGTITVGSWDTSAGDITLGGGDLYAQRTYSAAGTELLPSHTFTGDVDTGMYRHAVNVLGFTTAGKTAMTITANGTIRAYNNVGDFYYQFNINPTANRVINFPDASVTLPGGTLVPTDGTGATGNWDISVTGNAATVTNGVYTTRTIGTGNGLTGGGSLAADRTISLTGQAAALHDLSSNGLITRTSSGVVAARSIVNGNGTTVVNGNGVAGNPSISVSNIDSSHFGANIANNASGILDDDVKVVTSQAVFRNKGAHFLNSANLGVSGVTINGLPSWASEIEIYFEKVKFTAGSTWDVSGLIQFRVGGTLINSGYAGGCTFYDVYNTSTAGCLFTMFNTTRVGIIKLVAKHLGGNIWLLTLQGCDINEGFDLTSNSIITLSGPPNGITVNRINTNTAFDTTSKIHVYYS